MSRNSHNDDHGHSHAGTQGADREDSYFADDDLGLYVVCDGASGAAAGQLASRIAVDAVSEYIQQHGDDSGDVFGNYLATRAIQHAFAALLAAEATRPALRGMNTTVTLLLVRNHRAVVGHVGDSRLYVVREGELHQLTVDHALTDRTHGDPGLVETLEVDTFRVPLLADDLFMLCSDGLNPVMADAGWVASLARMRRLDWIADQLLARSEQVNDEADATVVLVRVEVEDRRPKLVHYINTELDVFQSFALAA